MILDEVKEEYVKDLLTKNKRTDGRAVDEYRPITIEKGIIPNAEGSALATIGDTKVLAGVKFDVMTPFPDRPEEGVFMVNSEFSPVAHPEFNPGPPDERSIELARVVDRAIRSAQCIDVKKLYREEAKVLGAFVDVYILDHCGNLIDCAALAAMAALTVARVPKYEAGKLVREESTGALELQRKALTCSFEKIDGKILLDCTNEEEIASSGRLTLGVCDGDLLCCAQKSGRAGFTADEFSQLIDLSTEKANQLMKML